MVKDWCHEGWPWNFNQTHLAYLRPTSLGRQMKQKVEWCDQGASQISGHHVNNLWKLGWRSSPMPWQRLGCWWVQRGGSAVWLGLQGRCCRDIQMEWTVHNDTLQQGRLKLLPNVWSAPIMFLSQWGWKWLSGRRMEGEVEVKCMKAFREI